MAGSDNIRGVNFQNLCVALKCLDMTEEAREATIRIEGKDDIVDFETLNATGEAVYVAQAKSICEPHTWTQSDLASILKAWSALESDTIKTYEFLTNGQCSPRNKIPQVLGNLKASREVDQADLDYLGDLGVNAPLPRLRRMHIRTRYGETTHLLSQVINRVARLLEFSRGEPSMKTAESIAEKLFLRVALPGGEREEALRTLTRQDLHEILSIPFAAQELSWTEELAAEFRAKTVERFKAPSTVMLAASLMTQEPDAAAFLDEIKLVSANTKTPIATTELLEEVGQAAICSPAGGGKTYTLRFLVAQSAENNKIPIYVEISNYRPGGLQSMLLYAFENVMQKKCGQELIEYLFRAKPLCVFLDGVTELPLRERNFLQLDLAEFMRRRKQVRLVVAGRHADGLRRLGMPLFLIEPLDRERKAKITQRCLSLTSDESHTAWIVAEKLTSRLGSIVNLPLFLVMSLSLYHRKLEPTSRFEVYDGFLEGIRHRHPLEVDFDPAIIALGCLCCDLIAQERKKAPRYWWLEKTRIVLAELRDLFAERSAETVINELENLGIMEKAASGTTIGLMHDSFVDYFAAAALSRGHRPMPRHLTPEWEDAVIFLAEGHGVSSDLAHKILEDNLVLSARVSPLDTREAPLAAPEFVEELLRKLIATHFTDRARKTLGINLETGLVIYYGKRKVYATLAPKTECQITGDAKEFGHIQEQSKVTLSMSINSGPVRILTTLWHVLVKEGLSKQNLPVAYAPISPKPRGALAAEIEIYFKQRNEALYHFAEEWFPSISTRLTGRIGWSGLEGHLFPPRKTPESKRLVGVEREEEHPFSYRHTPSGVNVNLADDYPRTDGGRWFHHTTAEGFLERRVPERDALAELDRELARLKPTNTYEASLWED